MNPVAGQGRRQWHIENRPPILSNHTETDEGHSVKRSLAHEFGIQEAVSEMASHFLRGLLEVSAKRSVFGGVQCLRGVGPPAGIDCQGPGQ